MSKICIDFPSALFLLRHGQTTWNFQKRMQGHTDIPLNDVGRKQAEQYGFRLKTLLKEQKILPTEISVRASTLQRAAETARIACAAADLTGPIQPEPRLIEQCYGKLEGMLFTDIQKEYPECWYMRLHAPLSYTPPQGEAGEDFKARIGAVINETRGATLLVGHFGMIRALVGLCRDNGIETDLEFETMSGSQDIIYMVRDGKLTLHTCGKEQ